MLKQDRNGSYQGIRSLHKIFCFNDLLLLLTLFRTSFTSLFRSVLINFIQFYSNENHNSLSLDACLSKIGTIRIKGFDHDVKFFCFNHLLLLILFWTSFTSLFRLVLNWRNENHHSLTFVEEKLERFLIEGFDHCIAKLFMIGQASKIINTVH